MSITIDIDEQLVADLGREEVEREFKKAIERLELRKLARQMADDLKDINLTNDPDWQKAREEAWVHSIIADRSIIGEFGSRIIDAQKALPSNKSADRYCTPSLHE